MTTTEIPNRAATPPPDTSPGSMRRVMTIQISASSATRPVLRAFTNSFTAAGLPHDKEPHS